MVVDARQPGVNVPPAFSEQPALLLKFSYKYASVSLTLNSWGIRANLSFNGEILPVAVPWEAVFAIGRFSPKGGPTEGREWPQPPPPEERRARVGGLRVVQ